MMGGCGPDLSGSGYGLVAGSCEYCNEHSGPQNVGNYLTSSESIMLPRMILLHGLELLISQCMNVIMSLQCLI